MFLPMMAGRASQKNWNWFLKRGSQLEKGRSGKRTPDRRNDSGQSMEV